MRITRADISRWFPFSWRDFFISAAILGCAVGLCLPLQKAGTSDGFAAPIFVLTVLLISRLTNGYLFGLLASLVGVVGVNFIFTSPYWALNFTLTGYPVTFLTLLMVSITTSTLTTRIKQQARLQAETLLKEADLKAKEALMAAREAGTREQEQARAELRKQADRLNQREEALEQKLGRLQERLTELDQRTDAFKEGEQRLQRERDDLQRERNGLQEERARLAGCSPEEARRELLEELRREMVAERAAMVRQQQEEARQCLQEQARGILLASMERCASALVQEGATSAVTLPNEEMKGRIIGKDGRNIRALETATGTNLLVDEAPLTVVVSCFDPVRREIARRVLEKLVDDGRIHPSRVEELVESVRQELATHMRQKGEEAAQRLSLVLPERLLEVLGRLEYRHSFSQNVLQHSLEVWTLAVTLAA